MHVRYLSLMVLLTGGCFDVDPPGDETETEAGTEGTDSTAGTTSPNDDGPLPDSSTGGTSTDPDTTTDDPDTTADPINMPPMIELAVDGSDAPPQLQNSAQITLEATVTDDGELASGVEFFDGATSLGVVDKAPFVLPLLLTSVDTGDHEFIATVTDDGGSQAESDPVSLNVDIDGGAIVGSEEGLFQMGGLFFHPGIGAVVDNEDNVIVMGSLSTPGFAVTGVGAVSLSPDLSSTNWQTSVPMALVEGEQQYLTFGQPWVSPNGTRVLMGGNTFDADGVLANNLTVFRLGVDGTIEPPFYMLSTDPKVQNIPLGGMAIDSEGFMLLHGPDSDITKVEASSGATQWNSAAGQAWTLSDAGGYRLRVDDSDDLVFNSATCNSKAGTCVLGIRKIRGFDGVEEWTQEITFSDELVFMHYGGSAAGPDGDIATLFGLFPPLGGGMRLVTHDSATGTLSGTFNFGSLSDQFSVADIAFDAQGYVVAVGTRLIDGDSDNREAFAMRFSVDGDLLWQEAIAFGGTDDQAMALTLDRQGHLVVVGASDITPSFFTFLGDVWVAQLDL